MSFVELVERCRGLDVPGRIVELLDPFDADTHYILKPKHSAFYGTSLDVLLQCWRTERLLLTTCSPRPSWRWCAMRRAAALVSFRDRASL